MLVKKVEYQQQWNTRCLWDSMQPETLYLTYRIAYTNLRCNSSCSYFLSLSESWFFYFHSTERSEGRIELGNSWSEEDVDSRRRYLSIYFISIKANWPQELSHSPLKWSGKEEKKIRRSTRVEISRDIIEEIEGTNWFLKGNWSMRKEREMITRLRRALASNLSRNEQNTKM